MGLRRAILLIGLLVLGCLLLEFLPGQDDADAPTAPEGVKPRPEPEEVEAEAVPREAAAGSPVIVRPEAAKETAPVEVPGFHPKLEGRVLDVITREPIVGAKVVYAALSDSGASWWGATTDLEGSFRIEPGEKYDPTGEWFEVRVAASGYRTWKGNPISAELEIELDRAGPPPLPGRITGRAVDSEGVPLSGVLEIILLDEVYSSTHQCAFADAEGRFELHGIPPGPHDVFLEWEGRWKNVFVPSGGEVFVELVTKGKRSGRAPTAAKLKKQEQLVSDMRSALEFVTDEARSHRLQEALRAESAKLLDLRQRAREGGKRTRPVRVDGLPEASPATLTARKGGARWVVPVRDGVAEFPALQPGNWRLSWVGPDGKGMSRDALVREGQGVLSLTFPDR